MPVDRILTGIVVVLYNRATVCAIDLSRHPLGRLGKTRSRKWYPSSKMAADGLVQAVPLFLGYVMNGDTSSREGEEQYCENVRGQE